MTGLTLKENEARLYINYVRYHWFAFPSYIFFSIVSHFSCLGIDGIGFYVVPGELEEVRSQNRLDIQRGSKGLAGLWCWWDSWRLRLLRRPPQLPAGPSHCLPHHYLMLRRYRQHNSEIKVSGQQINLKSAKNDGDLGQRAHSELASRHSVRGLIQSITRKKI